MQHVLGNYRPHIIFDPVRDIEGARADPDLFLSNRQLPIILDKIQYVPSRHVYFFIPLQGFPTQQDGRSQRTAPYIGTAIEIAISGVIQKYPDCLTSIRLHEVTGITPTIICQAYLYTWQMMSCLLAL